MNNLNAKPNTVEQAYKNGQNATSEGQNPFRNMGFEVSALNTAWHNGFDSRS